MQIKITAISAIVFGALGGSIAAGGSVDPCAQDNLGAIPADGFTRGVKLVGDRLYVLDGEVLSQEEAGLRIFDVSDPALPGLLGQLNTPGIASGIAVFGDRAFIADGGTGGLRVIDLNDPASPVEIGFRDSPGLASRVSLIEPLADGSPVRIALADGAEGVVILVVMPDGLILQEQTISTAGIASDVLAVGSVLFVAEGWDGLAVYDISVAGVAVEGARVATQNAAIGLAWDGDAGLMYVAEATGGVLAVDFSQPFAPVVVSEYNTPGTARGIVVAGSEVYVADGYRGLHTLDASVPPLLGIVETQAISGAALGLEIMPQPAGRVLFVAANQGGVQILNLQECDEECPADFAEPFGILTLADISVFISDFSNTFNNENRANALAPPEDVGDLADIVVFLESFNAGCP